VPYVECLQLISGAEFILTDSGGIQEEAATLGIPTGVLRDVTERPEGIAAGICKLLGSDSDAIYGWAVNPKKDGAQTNVYGDGDSAKQIIDLLTAP
jgi:UDP-N-acetylglucosamine 2-epimerase (non-hydrolysing)